MGRFSYYSPILIGFALVLMMNPTVREHRPAMSDPMIWPYIIAVGLLAGLVCQVIMIGAQGAFAQVLPAPGGRSIRGSGAMSGGWLLLLGVLMALVCLVLGFEELSRAAWTFGIGAAAAVVAAVGTYAWSWPTAQRDFAED
ncbi:MAG: hypothetical protein ACKVS9_03365 [Phycisphaerae bacterium]